MTLSIKSLYALDLAGTEVSRFSSALRGNLSAAKQNIQAIETMREAVFHPHLYLPLPQYSSSVKEPYKGTCQSFISEVKDTVNNTVNSMNYSAATPLLKTIGQLNEGKTFQAMHISSENEYPLSNCAGMSHAILKNLKKEHGIEGMLAVTRANLYTPFEHSAVIAECADGYVYVESCDDEEKRLIAVAFNSSVYGNGWSISATKPGNASPLILKRLSIDESRVETNFYSTNVINGDSIVMRKHLIFCASRCFPIVNTEQTKIIAIYPNKKEIVLEDRSDKENVKKETFSFEAIRSGPLKNTEGFFTKFQEFVKDGFVSPQELEQQLVTIATQEDRIRELYANIHIPPEKKKEGKPLIHKPAESPMPSISPQGFINSLLW